MATREPSTETPLTFAVLVFPGFPMMAFSSVIEPLRAANVLAKRECYRWIIVGATQGSVEASNGVVIQPGFFVDNAPKVDRIVVCSGGDADRRQVEGAEVALIHAEGGIMASHCTAIVGTGRNR